MTRKEFIDSVKVWLSIADQYKYETDGYKLDLDALTDVELLNLKPVSAEFIEFSPKIIPIIVPRMRPEIRYTIAYITELRYRQSEAWTRYLEKIETENLKIAEWLKKNGSKSL